MAVGPTPKVRSRKDGAAVPLDELDKRLLNLLQGSFPLEPRAFARVAVLAEVAEPVVLERTQRLLDERIIRRVKEETGMPVAAYNVSGEYSMLKAAAERGLLDERAAVLEANTGIRLAGADIVVTNHAKDAAEWLR